MKTNAFIQLAHNPIQTPHTECLPHLLVIVLFCVFVIQHNQYYYIINNKPMDTDERLSATEQIVEGRGIRE